MVIYFKYQLLILAPKQTALEVKREILTPVFHFYFPHIPPSAQSPQQFSGSGWAERLEMLSLFPDIPAIHSQFPVGLLRLDHPCPPFSEQALVVAPGTPASPRTLKPPPLLRPLESVDARLDSRITSSGYLALKTGQC